MGRLMESVDIDGSSFRKGKTRGLMRALDS